ncbi:MAG: hypothetical protein ACLQCU_02855 [Acidimicrobiales bacterium]
MNLLDSSRHLGGLRAVELTCFRRLGERAPRLVPASCARWAASASLAHAWRASLLEVLLPVSAGLPGLEELTILPEGTLGDELARALPDRGQALAERGRVRDPRDRDSREYDGLSLIADLSGRLYPLLLAEYARRLELCSPAADGAVVRAMGRAMADLEVVRAEGAVLRGRPG